MAVGHCDMRLVRRKVLSVLKLDRCSCLRIVRSVLFIRQRILILRRVGGRYSGIVHGGVMCCSVIASLSLLLCAVIADP